MITPESRTYVSQRLKLHWNEWGNGDAPPLVLVHGGQDHSRAWDWVAEDLQRDFHVIAPDLRGHGESDWSTDGHYSMAAYVYDLAELVHDQNLAPVTLVGHSLGGNICTRFTGLYPDAVSKLVSIEGLGLSPRLAAERDRIEPHDRLRAWIDHMRALDARSPRRYVSIEEAVERMQSQFPHLSDERVRHLTVHGLRQNEDGNFMWKFDNHVRSTFPHDLSTSDLQRLWGKISCPTLLIYGSDSFASNPATDGRISHFQNASLELIAEAGHWVHHDQFERFLAKLRSFLTA